MVKLLFSQLQNLSRVSVLSQNSHTLNLCSCYFVASFPYSHCWYLEFILPTFSFCKLRLSEIVLCISAHSGPASIRSIQGGWFLDIPLLASCYTHLSSCCYHYHCHSYSYFYTIRSKMLKSNFYYSQVLLKLSLSLSLSLSRACALSHLLAFSAGSFRNVFISKDWLFGKAMYLLAS